MVRGADVAEPPPSAMLAVTVSVPESNLPGGSVRPLLTSAAVGVTVEALKDLPSRVSVIVAPFANPFDSHCGCRQIICIASGDADW